MGTVIYNSQGGYTGYLGNVLFQTASCIGIATKNSMTYHNPHKDYFDYFKGVFGKFSNIEPNELSNITTEAHCESHFHYSDIILDRSINYNLTGYFQSHKYFQNCEEKIRSLFQFKEEIIDRITKKYRDVLLHPSPVSLHLRRGDYLQHPLHHPALPLEYYNKAIAQFPKDTLFFVFSDDPEYCKKHFIGHNFIIVERNNQGEDMCLMTLCDGGSIIANSTMSWWGAYLSNNKKVIAPKVWFGSAYSDWNTKDLYRENWIKI